MTVSTRIVALDTRDIRFPTSQSLDGSDAMHPSPDYSCAYVVLQTDSPGLEGHGLTFTNGRGTEVVVAAVRALEHLVVGRTLSEITADFRAFWRSLASEGQLRWLGPEKGVIHLATAAIVNAVWDLWAKREGKPLYRLLADLTPDELVGTIDFRYIEDAITPDEALALLTAQRDGREARLAEIERAGYPAYTTSPGWLGYTDERIGTLVREAAIAGFTRVKMKVGRDLEMDARRADIIRSALGPDGVLMMDANQFWGVDDAIEAMRTLGRYDPWWIEEPTSPDDILGHARIKREIAPIRVATGEHVQNRVIFKQLFQADAVDVCQLDACRIGGVNEALAVLLLAAKFGIPVCPHAGGVGLCEYVQHLAMFDYICVSGSLENRFVEWVDHLHEHFVDPAVVRDGRYVAPTAPGYTIEMHPESLARSPPNRVEVDRHVIVDAHVHLWDPAHTPQPWMTSEHAAIARPFGPEDLHPLLERNGIDAVVLVQGACLDSDTDYLLEEAARQEWIPAVTAWLALDDPPRSRARLGELEEQAAFRAVRHLIHNEDDPHWILRPEVLDSLALLEERGVPLELPVVFPRHLGDVPALAERFPGLQIVVDHLGKPPLGTDRMADWERQVRAAARLPNVAAKLSGLNTATERADWRAEDFLSACHSALEAFGPTRLMCGSDWPVALLNGDYDRVWEATRQVVEAIAGADSDGLLGENAARIYRFADVPHVSALPRGESSWQHR